MRSLARSDWPFSLARLEKGRAKTSRALPPTQMPILTRSTGSLFDPATAPEAAACLEADFEGAWTRNEAALRCGSGGEVAWPPPGAALGGAATELAAALVFGAVSGIGRAAGVADGCGWRERERERERRDVERKTPMPSPLISIPHLFTQLRPRPDRVRPARSPGRRGGRPPGRPGRPALPSPHPGRPGGRCPPGGGPCRRPLARCGRGRWRAGPPRPVGLRRA